MRFPNLSYSTRIGESMLPNFPTLRRKIPRRMRTIPNSSELSFSVTMLGGYDKCTFSVSGSVDALAQYRDSLGREVAVYDDLGIQVWEGFVNSVSIRFGRTEYKSGSLMDVVNVLKLRYTTPRFDTKPPTGGIEMETNDYLSPLRMGTMSRLLYGRFREIIIPPRPLTADEAHALATELAESLALPQSQMVIAEAESNTGTASFECLGYFHLMKKQVVDYFGQNGTAPAQPAWLVMTRPFSNPSNAISAPDPGETFFNISGVIPFDNSPTLRAYNDAAESAHAFLETQYALLNSRAYQRYSFGVYNNRSVYFRRSTLYDRPEVLLSVYGDTRSAESGGKSIARPGMVAKIVDVPLALNQTELTSFIIDNIEYSGGTLSLNAGTFSAIDEALRERGV